MRLQCYSLLASRMFLSGLKQVVLHFVHVNKMFRKSGSTREQVAALLFSMWTISIMQVGFPPVVARRMFPPCPTVELHGEHRCVHCLPHYLIIELLSLMYTFCLQWQASMMYQSPTLALLVHNFLAVTGYTTPCYNTWTKLLKGKCLCFLSCVVYLSWTYFFIFFCLMMH